MKPSERRANRKSQKGIDTVRREIEILQAKRDRAQNSAEQKFYEKQIMPLQVKIDSMEWVLEQRSSKRDR